MRLATLSLLFLALPALADPDVPRGKHAPPPSPTHVVVVETQLAAGGTQATLEPGVTVRVDGAADATTPKGKVHVTVVGPVEISGDVDGAALGERVSADTDLYAGGKVVGSAHAGAFVQVTGKGTTGRLAIATVGGLHAKAELAASAIGAAPADAVAYPPYDGLKLGSAAKAIKLYAEKKRKGAVVAQLDAGTWIVLLDGDDKASHVRTYGPVELEGWIAPDEIQQLNLTQPHVAAHLVKPTHEVFVTTPISASAGGAAIGVLHGGALVEVEDGKSKIVRVTTPGGVVVEGFVSAGDLRALEESVWAGN